MKKKENPAYNFSADIIRVLAISGVVVIHTANAVYGRPDFFGGISWWLAIIGNSLSRIAIPLFIMLSGYFILKKNEALSQSFRRTGERIILPLLFWFVVYLIWNAGNPSVANINYNAIIRLLSVNVFHLYFLIILTGLYLAAPLIRRFLRTANYTAQRNLTFGTLIGGIAIFLGQYLFYLCSPTNSFTYWIPYTGLFIAGYFLGNNLERFRHTKLYIIFFFITLSMTVLASYYYYFLHNNGNNALDARGCLTYYSDSYLSLNVVVMSICAYLLLMSLRVQRIPDSIRNLIFSVARASFGIYVLHVIFLDIFDSWLHFFDPIAPAWLYLIVKWFVIFFLSYVSTLLLVKIPYVRRLFGIAK